MVQHSNSFPERQDFTQLFAHAEQQIDYFVEGAIVEYTEDLVTEMERQKVSRTELAARLGSKRAFITKLLSGRNNFTLRKMVEVARALKCELRVHLQPDGVRTAWRDYPLMKSASRATTGRETVPAGLSGAATFGRILSPTRATTDISTSPRTRPVSVPNNSSVPYDKLPVAA